jgi:hypothetical protein
LRSLGRGYLQWAQRHPAHFRIVSARDLIDIEGSAALQHNIAEVRELTVQTLQAAQAQGQIAPALDAAALALLARATVYGLARMQLDGHFPQWDVASEAVPATMNATLDLLISLMASTARPAKARAGRENIA